MINSYPHFQPGALLKCTYFDLVWDYKSPGFREIEIFPGDIIMFIKNEPHHISGAPGGVFLAKKQLIWMNYSQIAFSFENIKTKK